MSAESTCRPRRDKSRDTAPPSKPDTRLNDLFGHSLGISGSMVAIGTPSDDSVAIDKVSHMFTMSLRKNRLSDSPATATRTSNPMNFAFNLPTWRSRVP
jgi:hypothetical protein